MYNYEILKPYIEAKYSKNIPFENKELYLLCGCENADQKASIRSLKSRYLKELESRKLAGLGIVTNEIKNTNETNNNSTVLPTSLNSVSKPSTPKESVILPYHILGLIKKYPEIPLFIYSKLYQNPHNSFYGEYMALWDTINKGLLDKEIEEYMKDVLQSYGNTLTQEEENKPFTEELDSYSYYVNRITNDIMWFSEWITTYLNKWSPYPINHIFLTLRITTFATLVHYYDYSNFDSDRRDKGYVKMDIMKLCNEFNRVSKEIGSPSKKDLATELNKYDGRWYEEDDYKEYGLNYHIRESEEEYESPVPELETELNRIKGSE